MLHMSTAWKSPYDDREEENPFIKEQFTALNPMLMDVLPLSLEEIFIYELGGADYCGQGHPVLIRRSLRKNITFLADLGNLSPVFYSMHCIDTAVIHGENPGNRCQSGKANRRG